MKRQSIAEQTLKKQVKILETKMSEIVTKITYLQKELASVQDIRDQLDKEIWTLQQAREKASAARKS